MDYKKVFFVFLVVGVFGFLIVIANTLPVSADDPVGPPGTVCAEPDKSGENYYDACIATKPIPLTSESCVDCYGECIGACAAGSYACGWDDLEYDICALACTIKAVACQASIEN